MPNAHHLDQPEQADPQHERRFHGQADRLRSPDRLARLEVPRVVALSLENLAVATLLDVGTGTGVFAEEFARQGLAVTGVDVNPELMSLAREYVPTGDFKTAPAEQLPFPDRSFDLVFLGHVLHETDQPFTALREARRVARGRVVVLEWPYREEPHGPPLEHRVSPETVAKLVSDAGYQTLEALTLSFMDLYRLTP